MATQVLLVERNNEKRLYVVTEETPPEHNWTHDQ
ncbi:hypothetical protein SAMN05216302_10756 [Nitrosomonas aestuarii]|uniref:Uncharacterized protein n=1 Tax=Nitrosomonas aestuarii TaxID=52441 RepID=A0A1I4H9S2_9PROT|nr:hypothetical protein SAMN05216302_10756 [Nitrosomonas aestuarii]